MQRAHRAVLGFPHLAQFILISAGIPTLFKSTEIYDGEGKTEIYGVAMPTDEDDQDGHFFYNHPERGAYSAA